MISNSTQNDTPFNIEKIITAINILIPNNEMVEIYDQEIIELLNLTSYDHHFFKWHIKQELFKELRKLK